MSLILSLLLSFLDINEFQDCENNVALFEHLGLLRPEKQRVLKFWLCHTNYFCITGEISYWKRNEAFHRGNGEAAVIGESCAWFNNGELHREGDNPAVVRSGSKEWFFRGKRHRKADKPAVLLESGRNWDKEWYFEGLLHRESGRPAVMTNRFKEWWVRGDQVGQTFYRRLR